MKTDAQLLAEFAHAGAEDSFAELVSRHGNMILSACLRVLGRHDLAEEATQAVLLVLASKASSCKGPALARWLHRVARDTSRNVLRSERRRRAHERRATEMRDERPGPPHPQTPGGVVFHDFVNTTTARHDLGTYADRLSPRTGACEPWQMPRAA
jgi:DNA-directed RNA polymerase specialized sigma24 family protein